MPINDRMRLIAREEADRASTGGGGGEFQRQITDLHEELHAAVTTVRRLEERVTALEACAESPTATQAAAKRTTTRKATSE